MTAIFYCSFCGRNQHEVEVMVAAPVHVAICDQCVDTAVETVARKRSELTRETGACSCQLPPGKEPGFAAVAFDCPQHGDES